MRCLGNNADVTLYSTGRPIVKDTFGVVDVDVLIKQAQAWPMASMPASFYFST